MSKRRNILTITITALILCGIFYFVVYVKTDPISLVAFSKSQYQQNIIDNLKKQAEAGNPQAMLSLASAYEKGKLVPKDNEQAKLWRKKAVETLEKKAESGDIEAIFFLALAYEEGKIVEKNDKTAFQWSLKGAEAGHAPSQNNLAVKYLSGKGTEKNTEKAIFWYEKAAEQDESYALSNLCALYFFGKYIPKDYRESAKYCLASAQKGNMDAAYLIGWQYLEGQGVEENNSEAIKWLTLASDKGNYEAQYTLGTIYAEGKKAQRDNQKAFELFERASKQNFPIAVYALAQHYAQGWGVKKDLFKAGELFRKAESLGSEDAKKYLRQQTRLCKTLVPPDLENEQLAKACILSSSEDDAQIQSAMAFMYQFGKTLEKNQNESVIWYRKAAEQGNLPAQVMLANAYLEGTGIGRDLVEAYAWSFLATLQEQKTNWDKFADQQNKASVLKEIEKEITPEQKEQALARAAEYRKKYETKETPP